MWWDRVSRAPGRPLSRPHHMKRPLVSGPVHCNAPHWIWMCRPTLQAAPGDP